MVLPGIPFLLPILNAQPFTGITLMHFISLILTLPVQFYVAKPMYTMAFKSFMHGAYTMDVLITIGTFTAFTCMSLLMV